MKIKYYKCKYCGKKGVHHLANTDHNILMRRGIWGECKYCDESFTDMEMIELEEEDKAAQ